MAASGVVSWVPGITCVIPLVFKNFQVIPGMKVFHSLLCLFLFSGLVAAQEPGPFAPPCEGCPTYVKPPYPHSGWWHNPEQPGTGMTLEVQNGILVANYYGYREDGSAAWYQISGPLVKSTSDDVYWELEAELLELANGQLLNGEYAEPVVVGSAGTMHMEFLQRHLLRYQVADGPLRSLSPFEFGATTARPFEPASNYDMPTHKEAAVLYGDEDIPEPEVPWLIIHRKDEPTIFWWGFGRTYQRVLWSVSLATDQSGIGIQYIMTFGDYDSFPHAIDAGTLACAPGSDLANLFNDLTASAATDAPICAVAMNVGNPDGVSRLYYLPVADFGDRYFTGVSEDGWVIEGYRLLFD